MKTFLMKSQAFVAKPQSSSKEDSVMVNFTGQIDEIWNHPGDKHSSTFVGDYVDEVSLWPCLWGIILARVIDVERFNLKVEINIIRV